MAILNIPFSIGQNVWWVSSGYKERYIKCPDCVGTEVLTLTLGTGEKVILDCATCSIGHERPTGIIKEIYFEHKPESFTCTNVRIDSTDEIYYYYHNRSANIRELFEDKEKCNLECEVLNKQKNEEQLERSIACLRSKKKDMVYSVSYWRGKRKSLLKNLEIVEKQLGISIEKNKK